MGITRTERRTALLLTVCRSVWTRVVLTAALTTSPLPAAGHHSLAMYDRTAPLMLRGTVSKVVLMGGGHSQLFLDVKDVSGRVDQWELEAAEDPNDPWITRILPGNQEPPVNAILRKLKFGTTVTATAFRLRESGKSAGLFTTLRDENGKEF